MTAHLFRTVAVLAATAAIVPAATSYAPRGDARKQGPFYSVAKAKLDRVDMAALDRWARQRRRAKQTHRRKR